MLINIPPRRCSRTFVCSVNVIAAHRKWRQMAPYPLRALASDTHRDKQQKQYKDDCVALMRKMILRSLVHMMQSFLLLLLLLKVIGRRPIFATAVQSSLKFYSSMPAFHCVLSRDALKQETPQNQNTEKTEGNISEVHRDVLISKHDTSFTTSPTATKSAERQPAFFLSFLSFFFWRRAGASRRQHPALVSRKCHIKF